MKVFTHSASLAYLLSTEMFNVLNDTIFPLAEKRYGKRISYIELYSDFFNKDESYMFYKDGVYYYPLTIVFRKNIHDILWIEWTFDMGKQKYKSRLPFLVTTPDVKICESVPEEFENAIKSMNLYYDKNDMMTCYEMGEGVYYKKGRLSQSFLDCMAIQIKDQLIALAGRELSLKRHCFRIRDDIPVLQNYNGDYFAIASIIDKIGNSFSVSVSWKENYDMSDYVTNDDIHFTLRDGHPIHFRCTKIDKVKEELKKIPTK